MKRIVCFLLAVSLMLSLSVFSFASPELIPVSPDSPEYIAPYDGIEPYGLVRPTGNLSVLSARSSQTSGSWTSLSDVDGLFTGSGGILSYIGTASSSYKSAFYVRSENLISRNDYVWFNFIGRVTDANGYVIQASDINYISLYLVTTSGNIDYSAGYVIPSSSNLFQFDDGYFQIALSNPNWDFSSNRYFALACNVTNSSVVSPLSFEVETFEMYDSESSATVPPFTFGDGAHTPAVPTPKDPNDASQYGSAKDQVEWYNDAFGGAVDPELDDKIVAGNEMLLQQEEIEQDVIADFQQYSSQVDPANIIFPTAVLNGMSFIGTTFMSSYNNLGDISFVISLSMMIGVVLVLIGRGEGALARGMSSSSRERRRTEYASERDMKKGG